MMLFLTCPKCHSRYERHPLTPAAQELCPACRNEASWDEIKTALASASAAPAGEAGAQAAASSGARPGASSVTSGSSASSVSGLSFGSGEFSNSFVNAKLAASRGQSSPFAPRVPLEELAVAARRESGLLAADRAEPVSEAASKSAARSMALIAPQSGATVAVAAPIQLAPDQPEIPLLAAGMDLSSAALPSFNIGGLPDASSTPKMDFSFQITPTAPVMGIQAPDVCGG